MFIDVHWCSLMFIDVHWCSLMFIDVHWCSLMFIGSSLVHHRVLCQKCHLANPWTQPRNRACPGAPAMTTLQCKGCFEPMGSATLFGCFNCSKHFLIYLFCMCTFIHLLVVYVCVCVCVCVLLMCVWYKIRYIYIQTEYWYISNIDTLHLNTDLQCCLCVFLCVVNLIFSGWWFEPLWKILVNWDD